MCKPGAWESSEIWTHPNNPDRHASFHISFALGHGTNARLSIVARRWRRDLESFICDVDVLEDKVGAQDKDKEAHDHRSATKSVLSTIHASSKVPNVAARRGGCGGGGNRRGSVRLNVTFQPRG